MHRPSACGQEARSIGRRSFRQRRPPNVIKAVVGEDWIIERAASGALKFVLYVNTFHHFLPDSAPLDL